MPIETTTSVAASEPVVAVTDLHKRFGGTAALRGVDLSIRPGEIHAFLGANGAGKSTLIKILAGVHAADEGHVTIRGRSLSEAIEAKRLSFVHQDLGLIDSMSIGENMAMAYGYPTRLRLIDWRAVDFAASRALQRLGWPLSLHRMVGDLSQAEKSIVAIARALAHDIDVLVLDEPTSSLPEHDVGRLFDALRMIRARNIGIMYVTHRLDEVFRLADAVTVLRDGSVVASYGDLSQLSPDQLVRDICGRLPARARATARVGRGMPALTITDLRSGSAGPVSFEVGAGEIVGLAGLRGQGHERIGRAIAGIDPIGSGTVEVGDKIARYGDAKGAIRAGIGFTSGKRVEESLATTLSVRENLFLNPFNFGRRSLSLLSRDAERRSAAGVLERFDVRPRDPERDISTLSGGNQQKVVLARLVDRGYRILVLEEPTIGVDIGAKSEIYRMLSAGAASGTPCLIVSSDLDELVQVCTRVLAFSAGRIVSEVGRDELTVEALTHAIGGGGSVAGGVLKPEIQPTKKKPEGTKPKPREHAVMNAIRELSKDISQPLPLGHDVADSTRSVTDGMRMSGVVQRILSNYGLVVFGVALVVVYAIVLPETFLSSQTFRAVMGASVIVTFLALAEMIVIASGNYDLSVAYGIGLLHILAMGMLVHANMPWPVVVLATVLLGAALGLINGVLVEYAKIDSFIATLGVGTILYGLGAWYTNGAQIVGDIPARFTALNDATLLGIPLPALFVLALVVILWVCFEFLPVGRRIYAIGGNRKAAELTGIPARRLVIGAFVVSGAIVGFAAVILAARLQVGQSAVGPEFLLPAFVGALLGSTTVRPGRVNTVGTIVAVLVLAIGISGLQQLGGGFYVEPIFQGASLILSVGIAGYAARRRKRGLR